MEQRSRLADAPLYFAHIAKTGGTSLTAAIARQYPEARIYKGDGTISVQYLESVAHELRGDAFIAGHPRPGAVKYLRNRARIITLLRDPARQAVSHYVHARVDERHPRHDQAMRLSFSNYMTTYPEYIVFQAVSIASSVYDDKNNIVDFVTEQVDDVVSIMRQFDFVGVTERLNEIGSIFSTLMFGGANLRIPKLNSSMFYGFDRDRLDEFLGEYRALKADPNLAPYLAAEQRIYEEAKSQMDANCAEIASLPGKQALGYLSANTFYSATGRQHGRCYEVPFNERAKNLIYGPYESVETGTYEVEFHISVSGLVRRPMVRLRIDVTADQTRTLAHKMIRGVPTPARSKLKFINRDSRDVLEYRVSGGGYGGDPRAACSEGFWRAWPARAPPRSASALPPWPSAILRNPAWVASRDAARR
jgi:hypothetical protein